MSLLLADDVWLPKSPRSHNTTDSPRSDASAAQPLPLIPPPMMARSNISVGLRCGMMRLMKVCVQVSIFYIYMEFVQDPVKNDIVIFNLILSFIKCLIK